MAPSRLCNAISKDRDVYFGGILGASIGRTDPITATMTLSMYAILTPGDVGKDGDVQFDDFLVLSSNFGTSTNMTWADGDFTGDGAVSFPDFLLFANFGGTEEISVP